MEAHKLLNHTNNKMTNPNFPYLLTIAHVTYVHIYAFEKKNLLIPVILT